MKMSNRTEFIRTKRCKQKTTREEISENHGASKRVKISIERSIENVDRYIGTGGYMSAPSIDGTVSMMGKAAVTDIDVVEDAIFEEIKQSKQIAKLPTHNEQSEATIIRTPLRSTVKNNYQNNQRLLVNYPNKTEIDNNDLKHRMSKKAYEILNASDQDKSELEKYGFNNYRDIVITHNIERSQDKMSYKESESLSAEYLENSLYDNTLNFSMFGNPQNFEESVNLSGKTLVECIKAFVEQKSIKNSQYRKRYRLILTYVLLLEEEWGITLSPQVIGVLFGTMFERYLYNQGLAPNSVEQLIYNLRAVLKWSARYGAKVKADMEEIRYRGVNAKPKIALSDDDISRIYWFDIDALNCRMHHKKTLKIVRDHFVLACFLGQRYSDTVRLDQTNFHGQEIFKVTQQKTGTTAVLEFNRLYPVYPPHVKEILERYDYKSPWQGNISNYNRYLHELMKCIGFDDEVKYEYKVAGCMVKKIYKKWELISSHVARRSFITNAVKRNINTQYIKRASGHHSDESFGKYVLLD